MTTQHDKFRDKKLAECEELRKQAKVANGVGSSLRNLAPVVVQELCGVVQLKLRTGRLAKEWETAVAASDKSDVPGDDKQLAAVAAMLMSFAKDAGHRVNAHGDSLVSRHETMLGRAAGIETTLAELAQLAPEPSDASELPPDSASVPEAVLGDESVPPPPPEDEARA